MATLYPELTEGELGTLHSRGEATVYRACRDGLPDDYDVYFSVGWILQRPDRHAHDGETDFVICHREHGFLTVEVKGGGIGFDATTGAWSSTDRSGNVHRIKDPARQARTAKYSILAKLREHPRWATSGAGRVLCGHAVFFPDLSNVEPLQRPDLPTTLIGSRNDLDSIDEWIRAAFDYWRNEDHTQGAIGESSLTIFRSVFARSFEVRPTLHGVLAEEEAERIRLTEDQARILDLLQSRRRVAVSGGAGTGKTVLAMEKAKRLAQEGIQTLLTCYNQRLASHLADSCAGVENLDVMSFHQLCRRRVKHADAVSGRNLFQEAKVTYPDAPEWDVQWPNALAYTMDVLESSYDAIVCDEGQDFREEYWFALELLLSSSKTSPLYVFFDDNQNLYERSGSFPIPDQPYPLTANCRNTDKIHDAVYLYYSGPRVAPPRIRGQDIGLLASPSVPRQAQKLHTKIVELISRGGVLPRDIAVLIADSPRKAMYYEALRHLPLPGPAHWLEEGTRMENAVLLDTVKRFKGLESPVVFLWGLGERGLERETDIRYVGMSRAKSLLYLVAPRAICEQVLTPE